MNLINNKNNKHDKAATIATLFTLAIIAAASSMGAAPAAATTTTTTTATTTTTPQPVTATTDNQSVNVLISWEPAEIQPGEDTQFMLDFQDPSSGESIPHVNYNFEIIDQDGAPVESMTDLHTHSGSDEQTVRFDNTGRFNLVATIIGTGIDPPFDTTQSGTAQTIIPVGQQQLSGAAVDGNTTTAPETSDSSTAAASTTPEAAGTTTTTTTTGNTTTSPGIELSPQPVYQDQVRQASETPVNETHTLSTVAGNGTLTLPNATEPIRTTSSGNLLVSLEGSTPTAAGEQIVMTEDGSESATAKLYEIARFNMQDGTGKGIAIAVVHTNSTGMLAPLNGMILAGQEEFRADGSRLVTMWEWESGIPLPTGNTTTSMEESPPSPMDATTTTTTTNATTTSDSNTTAATGEEGESQQEIVEEAVGGASVAE
jgi:hypothetical protein